MANTEGLTDEEMLKSMNETLRDWSTTTTTRSSSSRSSSRLAQRLGMPLGTSGPAAKVIRNSQPPVVQQTGNNSAESVRFKEQQQSTSSTIAQQAQPAPKGASEQEQPPPVLGQIVERKRGRRRNKGQQQQQRVGVRAPTPTLGFPSLKKPLGTFTPKKKSNNNNEAGADPSGSKDNNTTAATTTTIATTTTNDTAALIQASAKDADQMLASMSPEEIRASAQELQSHLSADTLAFLRNRKQKSKAVVVVNDDETTTTAKFDSKKSPMMDVEHQERREKERLAQLLSAVKTHEEMDAVYQAEVGQAPEFIQPQEADAASSSEPFDVACDLLRSTVPRQNLLAVRTVRDCLAKDYQGEGKTVVRLPTLTAWPYPIILPVSLRCLLDQAPNRVNGFALHTLALESLHLLLRLRCAAEHDTNLTDITWHDSTTIYQLIFGEDAVPSLSLDSVYKSSTVSPVSVGQHENVAYATASSSATATNDGQKFAQDPLWTLLSQMRIIPRLATMFQNFLVHSSQDGVPDVPEEAWLASLGILSMVAQRSPGAATAMVQHKTLLKDIARIAWDNVDAPEKIILSTVRLWTILARQGRTAAAGLELPPWGFLLGMHKASETGRRLQQWTLVLWRTLLSYGLAVHELESMLTLAAKHVAILNSESPLAALYLSCWSLMLKIHHEKVLNAVDDAIRDHEIRQLVKVRAWLHSCYRQSLSYLERAPENGPAWDNLVLVASSLRFCQQYILTAEDISPNPPGEYKSDESTVEDEISCIKCLQGLLDAGVVKAALALVAPTLFQNNINTSKKYEVANIRFLTDFTSMLRTLQRRLDDQSLENPAQEALVSLSTNLANTLVDLLTSEAMQLSKDGSSSDTLVDLGWRNRGRFVFIELLRLTRVEAKIDRAICVAMGVSTLACMQVGDEALVDRLLRIEVICLPLDLRSMILGQLRSSKQKELQIQHSASLNRSFLQDQPITPNLQSLRSEADSPGPKRDSDGSSVVLPLGQHWLWNILAGSASSDTTTERIVHVLTSTLKLLDELEEAASNGSCHYARTLMNGSKMYFLMNVCTQSEDILAEETIESLCSRLRCKYLQSMDASFVKSFADSCVEHASVQSLDTTDTKGGEDANPTSEEEKKLADALLEEKEDPAKSLSGKRLRIVMDFVNDLCTAFCDFGAQYSFFGTCFRVFLYPSFPSQIRCEVLRRLQGLLHLLDSPEEDADPSVLVQFLAEPQADGATLDTFSSCFTKSSPSRSRGLVENLAVASLGLSLALSARKGGLDLQRRRLSSLQPAILARVASVAHFNFRGGCGTLELSKFVLQGSPNKEEMTWDDVASLFSS